MKELGTHTLLKQLALIGTVFLYCLFFCVLQLYNSWPNSLAELKAYATKAWEGKDLSQVKEVAGVAGPGAAGAAAAAKGGVPAGATAVNITAVAGTAEDAPAPVPAKEDETTDVEKVALVEK